VDLVSTARVFGSTKEGDRGLWFVVGQEASRLRNVGVETDFLALYAHALGNRDWERELATLGRATRNESRQAAKKKEDESAACYKARPQTSKIDGIDAVRGSWGRRWARCLAQGSACFQAFKQVDCGQ